MADVLLLGFIAGFVRGGWSTGFLRRLVGLGYMAVSFVVGAYLREPLGALVIRVLPQVPSQYADMVGYSVAFGALVAALNLLTGPVLKRTAVSGVSKEMDRALGAVLGGVEAVLIISAAVVILDTYTGTTGSLRSDAGLGFLKSISDALDHSTIGQFLIHTTVPFVLTILGPLLPKDVSTLVPTNGLPGNGLPGLHPPTP